MTSKQKRPTHKWAVDQDYWDKLSDDEKTWLRQFNSEYYRGSFPSDREPIHAPELKKDCRRRHHGLERDAMAGAAYLEDGVEK